MLQRDGDVSSYTEASSPTPEGQEDVTATDMVSEAVRDVIDNLQALFEGDPDEDNA